MKPYDVKEVFKELYKPADTPHLIHIPQMAFCTVSGSGNPNDPEGSYKQAVELLYAVSYALREQMKRTVERQGFQGYVVPPLEGLWWQPGRQGYDMMQKETLHWISQIRLPDFVTADDFNRALQQVQLTKKCDPSLVQYRVYEEGLCVQIMHHGAFDDETASVLKMDEFIASEGYINDFSDLRHHHEIYLSNINRVVESRWKTILRHPIRRP